MHYLYSLIKRSPKFYSTQNACTHKQRLLVILGFAKSMLWPTPLPSYSPGDHFRFTLPGDGRFMANGDYLFVH